MYEANISVFTTSDIKKGQKGLMIKGNHSNSKWKCIPAQQRDFMPANWAEPN